MLIISVVYPEENLLFGDNIQHAEAALLRFKNEAEVALDVRVNKIFLAGHSQGGYLVTRLNTMHPSDGVIASAPVSSTSAHSPAAKMIYFADRRKRLRMNPHEPMVSSKSCL